MILGPIDASTVFQWYQQISGLTTVVGPIAPKAWADPEDCYATSKRFWYAEPLPLDADWNYTPVSDIQLADGAWIEEMM